MNCQQCKIECKDRAGKMFCSRACKLKYKYHNNKEFRAKRIKGMILNQKSKVKNLNDLTPEDINKLKLIRPELFK